MKKQVFKCVAEPIDILEVASEGEALRITVVARSDYWQEEPQEETIYLDVDAANDLRRLLEEYIIEQGGC
jgi:hypothetical protein